MSGAKTLDGIKLRGIARIAEEFGCELRQGTKHYLILNYPGLRPCPLATSTHAERMVTPWLAKATGYDRKQLYQAMKRGYWEEEK